MQSTSTFQILQVQAILCHSYLCIIVINYVVCNARKVIHKNEQPQVPTDHMKECVTTEQFLAWTYM